MLDHQTPPPCVIPLPRHPVTPSSRDCRQRQARRALLWGLAVFVGVQIVTALALEYRLPAYRDPYYAVRADRLQRRLRAAAGHAGKLVVMLGSSRTADGLSGSLVEAELGQPAIVFNLGIPGASHLAELLTFERLLADGVRPDVLLIEVLPPLLDARAGAETRWIPADRLAWRDLAVLKKYHLPVRELRHAWRGQWAFPWYTHRFALLSALAPRLLPLNVRQDWAYGGDDSGWVRRLPLTLTDADRCRALEHARGLYEHVLRSFRLGGPSCQALEQLLEQCRNRGIRTALVLMPEGTHFQSWYPPDAWRQTQEYLAALSRQYGAPVINARDWIADENFHDSHHLLEEGVKPFSRRLGREGVRPLLSGPAASTFVGREGASSRKP